MQFKTDSIKKILVIRYRSIGDILLCNPTLAGLRRRFPGAKIHLLIDDIFEEILYNNPNVDRLVLNRRHKENSGLKSDLETIKEIRSEKYDLVVDLQTGPRGAITTLLSGAKIRAGHPYRLRNRLCYNMYAEKASPDDHSWRIQFRTVRPFGADWPKKPELFLDVPDKAIESARGRLNKAGLMFDRPIVLLHPGARVQVKRWPAVKLGLLSRWLVDEKLCAVVLTGSEADRDEIKAIRKASGYALPFFTDLGLLELAALLKISNMVVCNDSGPMHMAGALNTPMVALFGPSDPTLWTPLGSPSITISCAPMECMPCDQNNCVREGDHCMTHIEIDEVKLAIERLGVLT